ncbi:MAG: SCO family protein [Candidatus Thiodiazotropha endolucinida]|uniref:SCO family protein n=1 Tax=Candidatus Thiodiazotropha taylori TaxID=2792791 RepID=A0A9E4NIL0_9GAMM|nr:SCO family protein [Candidatus Thiodiazotropha endolucinida]MCG7977617.1 SCO family protein [Candidatus Thiodiazotropha taylori]MCW4235742.1 SCO family protein [Candidatus Thiodiazotropha endolucinida]
MFRIIFFSFTLLILFSSAASDEMAQKDEILSSRSESPGGDFVLYSSQGKVSLKQFRGKVVLLYFGYTKCPDVCPTSLSIIAQALNELSEEELKSVHGVFISVDPKRDDVQVLDEYVRHFHPNLVGVTGSEGEVAEVARRYGAQYEEVALEGSDFGYAVNHSSVTYLITPEGDLRFMLPHQTPAFVILEAIRYLLADTM